MRYRNLLPLALVAAGCGGGKSKADKPKAGICDASAKFLAKRLGPELAGVVTKTTLPGGQVTPEGVDPGRGCVLVYTQVAEEMPGEGLPPDEVQDPATDHSLAFVLPGARGRVQIHLIDPSKASPGPVMLGVELRDVSGDGKPDVLVSEASSSFTKPYKGLRVFDVSGDEEPPREVFSEKLGVTTREGLDLAATWKTGTASEKRALILEGGGTFKIFTWDEKARRFNFDQAATDKVNPKPPPPPEAAPAEGAPADGEKKPAEGGKKPAEGGKKPAEGGKKPEEGVPVLFPDKKSKKGKKDDLPLVIP